MKHRSENIDKYFSTFPFYKKKILCKAPFTSLRLSLSGNIEVCCLNKDFVIGKYPSTSIKDAWFGEKVKQLRKCIHENDLSLGCNECLAQINMGALSSVKARSFDHLKINKNGYPSLIEFELNNTCNLECIMCNPLTSSAIQKKCNFKENPANPYNLSLIKELEDFIPHLSHANFIGGEPLLIPLYFSIIEELLRINPKIRINLNTNGTVWNNKIQSLIDKGCFDIGVSIDSIVKETFEAIRININFESVFKNLDIFQNYSKSHKASLRVFVCAIEQNAFEIPELVKYFENRNIQVYFNLVYIPHSLSLWYKGSDYLRSVRTFYQKNRIKKNCGNAKRFDDFIMQLKTWEDEAVKREINLKQYIDCNSAELTDIFILKAKQHIHDDPQINITIEDLIVIVNLIIADKTEKQKRDIFLFLFSMHISKSMETLLSNNPDYLNYYIENNFKD